MADVMSKPPECTRRCDGLHRSGVTPIGQYDVCRIKQQGYQNGSEWLCPPWRRSEYTKERIRITLSINSKYVNFFRNT